MNQFKNLYFLFAIVSCSVLMFSCKKKEEEPITPVDQNPVAFTPGFSAEIDNIPFDVQNYSWDYNSVDSTISINAATDQIGSMADSTHYIGLTVPSEILPGTYTFTGDEITGYYNVGLDAEDQYSPPSGSGTLVILSHNKTDKKIVGSFNFVAVPSPGNPNSNIYDISDGHFAINYN